MRLMGDVVTNVMQERRRQHERAMIAREDLTLSQAIKDFLCEFGYLPRVSFFISESPADRMDCCEFLIGKIGCGSRFIFQISQAIDYYPFPESPVASTYHI